MTDEADATVPAPDPAAILRSRAFVVLLIFAAVVGVIVSFTSWAFLELVHRTQTGLFTNLPDKLDLSPIPSWWYFVVLGIAALPVTFAIVRLPGNGGHVPAHGLRVGGNEPNMVPGIALAAFVTLSFGLVLGPEAPLIAIGAGIATFTTQRIRKNAEPQLLMVMAAAGSFAAISVIFGSPIVAAVLLIEASGLGGAVLPVILIPGLIAAGIGSLIFIGMSHWTGLNTSAYSLVPLHLAPFSGVTWEEIGWAIALGVAGAIITQAIRRIGLTGAAGAAKRPLIVIPIAALVVAALAILFNDTTTHGVNTTAAVAVGMGVMIASFLKLPLSAIIIATALTASAGLGVGPLIIVGVVTAYLTTLALEGRLGAPHTTDQTAVPSD